MSDFDTSLPSTRQIQTYIQEKKEVEIKLITNDLYVGKVFWQDPNCICLFGQYDSPILIWRQSIVYLKAKN
ncbi:MAG: RNA-binding protein hfq [Trichodesmium sp. St2_bin6]|uniref:Hfq-related domain-containing protein n=1 Tax=Trichodesmium erythraeum (strain IMS101) TaxID=203124 RepID=Q116P2_TRIEI|nr:RNA-binding protein hfq [Trichodesmium erythraeum GBRTRLIN201]MCH2049284.1 RNA-binding protein hfq [Trichodesmium sp. ALOHA_ZT_67]MCL2929261.1 RNA-binding protein hfq [Trichodesmium sp. MAG_R01]MDE5072011.1 RNA-binding protein hfq [Trichodesmium sp. St5_bin8]MDE5077866.1 RNA-binding protein hfq [Trichodesmium sp. St2_bin6]MDE5090652.1 RNA-binding protein hfq [Trichodesmium sp. St18_bin3_1_1]MDE5094729.1 RNA-binding protein hfq [Trichodesmium sp. St11_bin5]MDE5103528.1 RNA-binding protein 